MCSDKPGNYMPDGLTPIWRPVSKLRFKPVCNQARIGGSSRLGGEVGGSYLLDAGDWSASGGAFREDRRSKASPVGGSSPGQVEYAKTLGGRLTQKLRRNGEDAVGDVEGGGRVAELVGDHANDIPLSS